ncbi:MAG: hypothetical protein V2B18_12140 [Pseudomonadota bacterium]
MAILQIDVDGRSTASVETCDCVDEALAWMRRLVEKSGESRVTAVGIDSYLSWSSGPSGWRPMDLFLRQRYPTVMNSVFSSNSASGSMAIQGMAMALRLRQLWPDVLLNETHPKVLYNALTHQRYSSGRAMNQWLLEQFNPPLTVPIYNEHQWDALLSAWATLMGMRGQWERDLMADAADLLFPAGDVTYYWP